MGRPEILRRCLASLDAGCLLPDEIIVSDDSHSPEAVEAVCRDFPRVRYSRGPRRGLCANRNAGLAACSGEAIALVDDDAIVSLEFLWLASEILAGFGPETILTGDVLEDGLRLTPPTNPSFWGHFGQPSRGSYKTVNLNCNLFPRSAFQVACFDETIAYGYEDMDLCAHLLVRGYRISHHSELVNQHLPPPKDADTLGRQRGQSEQARFYTSLKRYLLWQRQPLKALAYTILAPLHQAMHHLRRGEISLLWVGVPQMGRAVRAILWLAITRGKQ